MADGSLYSRLEAAFAEAGDKVLFDRPGAAPVTYATFQALVGQYANALVGAGVVPGDRIMVQVGKSVENAALYLASLKVGGVFNPLNTAYTPAELEYFVGDAEPRVLVVDPKALSTLAPIAEAAGVKSVMTLDTNGGGTLPELAAGLSAEGETIARDPKDLAALLYTSGTTGRSKGAMITHENLLSNAETLVDYWGFTDRDVLLHALPIFHVHGLFVALNVAFLSRASMIWMGKFDAEIVMSELPKATAMMGVPTFYTRLLAEPAFGRDETTKMRIFIAGSAPLLAETHDGFAERTGHRIVERYGMTEAGMITSNPYHDGDRLAGTVGYALPGVSVRIADDAGHEVPTGEVGTLEVKGPNVFSGYWRLPEKTKEEFRDDGYFVSGDLATQAEDGRVTIVGRAKDLIISGGYNIYPKEIEVELNEMDAIDESAVIGVPHPDFGEGVVAVVTPVDPSNPPAPEAIIDALGARLARFKLPKALVVVDALPRNAMGKVQKNVLRDTYADALKSN